MHSGFLCRILTTGNLGVDDFEKLYAVQATRDLGRLASVTGIVVITHVELLAHMKKVKEGDEEAIKIAQTSG